MRVNYFKHLSCYEIIIIIMKLQSLIVSVLIGTVGIRYIILKSNQK